MKKTLFFLILIISVCTYSFTQEVQSINTGYYTLIIPDQSETLHETSVLFNTIYEEFYKLFHFSSNTEQLPVRIFNSRETFSEYIFAKTKQKTNSYTLLKNNNLIELIVYQDTSSQNYLGFCTHSLVKNLFLQYLYTAVKNPPLWIRDGFLAYFDTNTINKTETAPYSTIELSPWLEYAKKIILLHENYTVSDLLRASTKIDSYDFSSCAWAFVSFLLHTEKKEYNRVFHESLVLLEEKNKTQDLNLIENTTFIYDKFINILDIEQLNLDFKQWLTQIKTVNERIQSGIYAYNDGNYEDSYTEFSKALELKQEPLIYYYLGLNLFAQKQHEKAEEMYLQSLEKGGEKGPIYWSLALNAFDAHSFDLSKEYALNAGKIQPERYKGLVEKLIKNMPEDTIEIPDVHLSSDAIGSDEE